MFVLKHITSTVEHDSYLISTISHILDTLKSQFGAVTGPYNDVTESFFCRKQDALETLQEF